MEKRNGRVVGLMTQGTLSLGEPMEDVVGLERALGLASGSAVRYPPVRPADPGARHLMVLVTDSAAVDAARPDATALLSVLHAAGAGGCYIHCLDENAPKAAYARFFNPTVGLGASLAFNKPRVFMFSAILGIFVEGVCGVSCATTLVLQCGHEVASAEN